jgi:hypothetical protein
MEMSHDETAADADADADAYAMWADAVEDVEMRMQGVGDGPREDDMEGEWESDEVEDEIEDEEELIYGDGDDEVDAGDHEEIEVGNTPPVDEPVNLGHNHQHSDCGAGCPVYDAAIGSPWPADAPTVQPESEPEPERPPASTPAVRARAKKVRKPKAGSKAKSARAASKPKRKRAVKTQSKKRSTAKKR